MTGKEEKREGREGKGREGKGKEGNSQVSKARLFQYCCFFFTEDLILTPAFGTQTIKKCWSFYSFV
jgi:hypothetical protein